MPNAFDTPLTGPQATLAERGAPLPQPEPPPAQPPGAVATGQPAPNQGLYIFPHLDQFAAVWNTQSRVYRYTFDEALRHSRQNAVAYRRDPVVYEALRARQMPTAGCEWHLEPRNDFDPLEVEHAKRCRDAVEDTPNLQQLLMYLLEAVWFGRYGASLAYEWDYSQGYRRVVPTGHYPIDGDKLVFRYSGEVGILVGPQYQGSWIPTDRGRAHIATPQERQLLIVHEHEREDADFYSPEMAGRVHGVGVRDRLYWFLYMKQRVLAWMMEFLERVGAGGVMVFFYESGNPESLNEVKEAAEKSNKNTAFLFPRYADGKTGPGFQRLEPSMAGAELLDSLITGYFDVIIRRLILGQSLSSTAAGTGLGSGVADFHQETLNRILKYDARNLQETLTRDFVSVISRHIDPTRRPPKWVFDVDKPNAGEHLGAAQAFFEMGGQIDEDSLRSVLGLPKPKPGSATLSLLARQNPQMAAMLGMSGGVLPRTPDARGPTVPGSAGGLPFGGGFGMVSGPQTITPFGSAIDPRLLGSPGNPADPFTQILGQGRI